MKCTYPSLSPALPPSHALSAVEYCNFVHTLPLIIIMHYQETHYYYHYYSLSLSLSPPLSPSLHPVAVNV